MDHTLIAVILISLLPWASSLILLAVAYSKSIKLNTKLSDKLFMISSFEKGGQPLAATAERIIKDQKAKVEQKTRNQRPMEKKVFPQSGISFVHGVE